MHLRFLSVLWIVAANLAATAEPGRVVIGSKTFAESRLLGEIMAQAIERDTNLEVERRFGLGGTMICFSALKNGEIDLYAEYTGTGLVTMLKEPPTGDPLRTYYRVRREFEKRHALHWLDPFGFNNTYALAMREDHAEELGISRISDLEGRDELSIGFGHEFLNRPDGWPGLRAAYGLSFADIRGIEHGLAYPAIDSGEVDVIDVYTTDGKLADYELRVLEDDRRFFPAYHAAPLIRGETLARHPQLRAVLGELAFALPDERMRRLNGQVEGGGRRFAVVAGEFLDGTDIEGDPTSGAVTGPRARGFPALMRARLGATFALTWEHIQLTGLSVLLACAVGIPLGVAIVRWHALAQPVLWITGILQTIPSLALLAFMIPLLGLGFKAAIAALFLYALLPIVRNTYTGIKGVDADLLEAARGMGLTRRQILRLVQLPLATRTIMAGVRTSTVIGVGVATLAAFVGAGGLGEPILTGLQLDDVNLILTGALPAALLAVLVDLGLGRLERLLAPKGV